MRDIRVGDFNPKRFQMLMSAYVLITAGPWWDRLCVVVCVRASLTKTCIPVARRALPH